MLGIAADHAGYELKNTLIEYLNGLGYEVKDFGTHSAESMDYPDVAHPLAEEGCRKLNTQTITAPLTTSKRCSYIY